MPFTCCNSAARRLYPQARPQAWPGARMVLPPRTPRSAAVGAEGVRCIEAPPRGKNCCPQRAAVGGHARQVALLSERFSWWHDSMLCGMSALARQNLPMVIESVGDDNYQAAIRY